MKKLIFLSVFIGIFVFASTEANAQKPTRITFAKGATEKVVSGSMTGFGSKRVYVIKVKSGQTLTTENSGDNYITISIKAPKGSTYEPDLAANCHDQHEVAPTAAGDYIITVTECQKADPWRGSFKFKVKVN
ncbi:MAG TPA: hypothetical protein PKA82_05945 [Pyrinomonadaceae bacterium]|nr:hypothetical protein [Pyrinomonadaceae bacterium]